MIVYKALFSLALWSQIAYHTFWTRVVIRLSIKQTHLYLILVM